MEIDEMEDIKEIEKPDAKNIEPSNTFYNEIHDYMSYDMQKEKVLNEAGVNTGLSDVINKMQQSKSEYDFLQSISQYADKPILDFLNKKIKEELLKNKDIIVHAVRNYPDELGYSIFLTEYSHENVTRIFDISYRFGQHGIFKKFPIHLELLDSNIFSLDMVYQCETVI